MKECGHSLRPVPTQIDLKRHWQVQHEFGTSRLLDHVSDLIPARDSRPVYVVRRNEKDRVYSKLPEDRKRNFVVVAVTIVECDQHSRPLRRRGVLKESED